MQEPGAASPPSQSLNYTAVMTPAWSLQKQAGKSLSYSEEHSMYTALLLASQATRDNSGWTQSRKHPWGERADLWTGGVQDTLSQLQDAEKTKLKTT